MARTRPVPGTVPQRGAVGAVDSVDGRVMVVVRTCGSEGANIDRSRTVGVGAVAQLMETIQAPST